MVPTGYFDFWNNTSNDASNNKNKNNSFYSFILQKSIYQKIKYMLKNNKEKTMKPEKMKGQNGKKQPLWNMKKKKANVL